MMWSRFIIEKYHCSYNRHISLYGFDTNWPLKGTQSVPAFHHSHNVLCHLPANMKNVHQYHVNQREVHILVGFFLPPFPTDIHPCIMHHLWNWSISKHKPMSSQWRRDERNGVSNHRRLGCLLNRFFRCRSKKTSKFRVTGLCAGNHRWPLNSPHKGPVTRKMFPFHGVIMYAISSNIMNQHHRICLTYVIINHPSYVILRSCVCNLSDSICWWWKNTLAMQTPYGLLFLCPMVACNNLCHFCCNTNATPTYPFSAIFFAEKEVL